MNHIMIEYVPALGIGCFFQYSLCYVHAILILKVLGQLHSVVGGGRGGYPPRDCGVTCSVVKSLCMLSMHAEFG